MKKVLAGVVAAAMVSGFGTMSVFAAGGGWGCHHGGNGYAYTSCAYVDENGDGICDTCGMGNGSSWHGGYHYVDANGDGICDNYADGTCPAYDTGYTYGRHHGRHHR
ncbi:hypothetical protein VSQ48_01710 [Candidatus Ventrimonas sp. KK005]